MGRAHTYAYRAIPFFYGNTPVPIKLEAVFSGHIKKAQAAAAENGFSFATDDLDAFFARGELDIVHVCTPNALHKKALDMAIRRGTHIYCEKPVGVNYAEAIQIAEQAKTKRIITKTGFHTRYYPCVMRAKQLLESGSLGRPLGFYIRYFSMNRLQGQASPNAQKSGALLDLGSHCLDMAYHLLGDFGSIFGETEWTISQRSDGMDEDAFHSIIKMKNGAVGVIEASKTAQGANNDYSVEINCEKGSLRFSLEELDWLFVYDANDIGGDYGGNRGYKRIECLNRYPMRQFPSPRHSVGWLGGHIHSIYDFLGAIRDGIPACPDLSDGAYVQLAIEMIEQSAERGSWMKF